MGNEERQPHPADWDPRSPDVLRDQIAAYDEMRARCPVAYSEYLHWSVFKHADIVRILNDPTTFSNEVSAHRSVPNGMDPPVHTEYRRVIEPYFSPERMAAFEPVCKHLAERLVAELPADRDFEVMSELARDFALEAQAAFLDWPAELHEPLREWTHKNHEATLSGDRVATAAVALEFDRHIRSVLDERRRRRVTNADDVASRLLREQLGDRGLTDEEIVSILRNWTVGELATIAASVGILVQYLAAHADVAETVRERRDLLPAAIDEVLRIHPPLIASRRRATCPASVGQRFLLAGDRLTVMWASANRDEHVFGTPDGFRLDRDPADNLLYGAGIHVCPGAPLARLELRLLLQALLESNRRIVLSSERSPVPAVYPASGFSALWVHFA
jgi:cytochrome P450